MASLAASFNNEAIVVAVDIEMIVTIVVIVMTAVVAVASSKRKDIKAAL